MAEEALWGFRRSSVQLGSVLGVAAGGGPGLLLLVAGCRGGKARGEQVLLWCWIIFCSLFSDSGSLEVAGAEGTAWYWLS